MTPTLATPRECTACSACISICPRKALYKVLDSDGHYIIQLSKENCIQCGLCERICPIIAKNTYGTNKMNETKTYTGWSLDNAYRKNGTSGGVFGIIAHNFILSGGVVIGATLNNNVCMHIAIDDVKQIPLLQGSKYLYSEMDGIYNKIKNLLHNGTKVLFSGLPCQVAGVISYFGNNPFRSNLYTIDLVCGGIPSSLLMDRFLQETPKATINSFRKKHLYVLKYDQCHQTKESFAHNLLISGFLSGLTNRYSCYKCKFAYAHRKSDITLGDYWQKNIDENTIKGASLILSHSDNAEKLLSATNLYKKEVKWSDFLPHNPKIVKGRIKWENRWERRYLGVLYKRIPFYYFNVIYSSNVKWFDIISFCYLIYKKVRMIIEKKERKIYVTKFLTK